MFFRSQPLLRPRSTKKTGCRHARLENLEPRLVLDGAAELVADLNTMPSGRGADGAFDFAWLGNELFFVADDGTGDVELWKSDGTETGTVRVKDIRPGSQGSFPRYMVAMEDRIFFTAYDDSHGRELWITDGTEQGTARVTDLVPGRIDSFDSFGNDQELLAVGGRLFFSFDGELWASDGTESGTRMVKDIKPGPDASNPGGFTDVNGQLYFVAADADERRLWQSDGTESGTVPVDQVPPHLAPRAGIVSVGSDLFYTIRTDDLDRRPLWKIDLSGVESPTLIYDGRTGLGSIRRVGDLIFFESEGELGRGDELWRTDGTEAGTFRVATSAGGTARISDVLAVGGELFFMVSDHGSRELWRSDGTIQGTRRQTGVENQPRYWRDVDGSLYFTMDDANGTELWWVDGEQLTQLDIRPGPESSYPAVIAGRDGVTFVWTNEPGLWVTDGTQEGTMPINTTIAGPSSGGGLASLAALDGGFVFLTENPARSLLHSDGTAAGTRQITTEVELNDPDNLTQLANKVYFVTRGSDDSIGGLWSTDGTDVGTEPIWFSSSTYEWHNLTVYAGKLYFTAASDRKDTQLWASDGTPEGTLLVHDLKVPHTYWWETDPELAVVNDTLYIVLDGLDEVELWKSDGTQTGTQLVTTLPGIPLERIVKLHPAEDQLFIVADPWSEAQVWRSDGSAEGTLKLAEKPDGVQTHRRSQAFGNKFVFPFWDTESGNELWISDGTVEGTGLLKDIVPGQEGIWPKLLTTVDDTLYFGAHGSLWKTDGTEAGTESVTELSVGTALGDEADALSVNGLLYFGASDGETGVELWRSDGTEEGTVRLTDIAPGTASSLPKYPNLTEVDGHIYFAANDGFHGHELWRIPVDPLPGDADGNGTVDFGDFLRLSTNFGRDEDVVFADGDFDENGTIDFADFLILSANFGRQGTPVTMQSAEDEPATLSAKFVESLAEDLDEEQVPIEMLPSPLG